MKLSSFQQCRWLKYSHLHIGTAADQDQICKFYILPSSCPGTDGQDTAEIWNLRLSTQPTCDHYFSQKMGGGGQHSEVTVSCYYDITSTMSLMVTVRKMTYCLSIKFLSAQIRQISTYNQYHCIQIQG